MKDISKNSFSNEQDQEYGHGYRRKSRAWRAAQSDGGHEESAYFPRGPSGEME
jgi:hypothetical protein